MRHSFPVKSLQDDPFIMLEKGTKAEITEIYQKRTDTKAQVHHF